MRLKSLKRRKECQEHTWSTTVNSGLRRSICTACGAITLELLDGANQAVPLYRSREDVPVTVW